MCEEKKRGKERLKNRNKPKKRRDGGDKIFEAILTKTSQT